MGTGQMMITMVALVLLSVVILRVTNGFLMTDTLMLDSKVKLQAISICASIIEDGVGLAFDENTVDISNSPRIYATSLSQLTSPDSLKAESGESYPNFDDIDDYNNFHLTADNINNPFKDMYGDEYDITCKVDYVNSLNPDVPLNTRTWHKRLLVMVTSKVMDTVGYSGYNKTKPDTIKMSVIQSNYAY